MHFKRELTTFKNGKDVTFKQRMVLYKILVNVGVAERSKAMKV